MQFLFEQILNGLALAFLGSMVLCTLLGVLIERLVYCSLLAFPPYVPLIASSAAMLTVGELCRLISGPQILTVTAKLPFLDLDLAGVHLC